MRRKEISRRERKRELITRELLNGKNWADPMCGPMIIPGDKNNCRLVDRARGGDFLTPSRRK